MESGNSHVEALQREMFAIDDLYVEYAEEKKKYARLHMKYQGALNSLRKTREELVDAERLVNQYKASSVTLDEYEAITVKLEASQIEYSILRDEYNNFVNTAELRYQNSCKELNDKIQALEGSETQKCPQQRAGKGRPRGRPTNNAKLQQIYDELDAKNVRLKAQSDEWHAKFVNLELQNADILNRHDSLLSEVNILKGQLQERDDKLRCMQLESNSAEIQLIEHEEVIECCELESRGALHEQADELFSEECSVNKNAIEIQEKIGYEESPVSSDVDEDSYNEAKRLSRSIAVVSPLPPSPKPKRCSNIAQRDEDLLEIIPCDDSLQTQNEYVISSPALVNRPLHCVNMRAMYTQTDELKKYCTTSTQTRLRRNAQLRVNRLSGKITKVRKNLPRKRVNCGTINHMFNCKYCLSKFTRKVIAANRNTYIIKQGDGTELLIEKIIKGSEKTKEDITTNAEKASVGTIKNSEEVDLIREIVEPRSVDSGYIRTDTDGENDGSITVDRQNIPANESALKNKPGSTKKKSQRYVCCAKRKREIRKRKAKCRNCVNNLESDDEFSTTSSLADYSDSPKGTEKASNAPSSAAESNENRHNQQAVEQMSSTDANEKGSLESGVLDLSVSKNKSSTPSSITSEKSEVLDLSVFKDKSSTPSFITRRESEILDLSVSKNKSSTPSSVVNMITSNHIKSYNDFSMSKPYTIVSTPNVTVDRNEEQIEIISSIPNHKSGGPGVSLKEPNHCNKMECPNNAIAESKNQGCTSSSETRYESPPNQLNNHSMDENQQSTPLPPNASDYKARIVDDLFSYSSLSSSTPNSIKSCNKRKMKGSLSFNTSYLIEAEVEIHAAPKSFRSVNSKIQQISLQNSKDSIAVDNCGFIIPLCSEVTDADPSNLRPDKQKVLELFGADSELDTSFQSEIDLSQGPEVKKKCRKVQKDSNKIPKKSLAVGGTLGFEDKNYISTRLRKRNAAAAQKSALVTTLKTNAGEKSNASVPNQTLVSKKRAVVANKKLKNVSVMKTRSATRKAGIVKVHDPLMSCILTTCKSHGDQESSSNCVRNFNRYVAVVEDSLRNRENSSAKSIEAGRNEDSAPYLGKKRIAHTAKHNKMSKSPNCKVEIMQQTNELSKSSTSVVSACSRLDNDRLENKNVNGIQALNQELSECCGAINSGQLVVSISQKDLANVEEHTKLRTTDDNNTTDDLKYGAKGLLSIAKQPHSINQNSANIKSPESSCRRSGGDVADGNREYCKNQSSNIFRILKTAADQKEALVKSGRISEMQLESDSKRQHPGKRMKSPNSRDVELSSLESCHKWSSSLGQLESDTKKQRLDRRMKSPNGRGVDLLSPEPPHNTRSDLGQLKTDSQKQQPGKRMKFPNSRNVDLPRPEPPHNKRFALRQLENDSKKPYPVKTMKSLNSRDVELPKPEPVSHNARSALVQLESDSKKQHPGKRMKSPNSRDVDLPNPEPPSSHNKRPVFGQLESYSQQQHPGKRMKSPNGRDVDLPSPEPSSSHNKRSVLMQLESDFQKQHPSKRILSPNSRDVDLPSPEPSASHNKRSVLGQLESDSQQQHPGKRMKSPNSRDIDLPSPEPSHNKRSVMGQLESDSQQQHPGKRMKSPNSRDVDLPSSEPSSSHNKRSVLVQLENDSKKPHPVKRMKSPNGRDVDLPNPESVSQNARSVLVQLESDSKKQHPGKRMKSPNSRDFELPSPEPSSSHNKRSVVGQLENNTQQQYRGKRMKSPNSRDVDLPSPEPPPYKKWSSLGSPRRSLRIDDVESSIPTEQNLNHQKAAEKVASSLVNGGTERTSFKRPLCKKRSVPLQSPASPESKTEDVEPVAPKIIPLERIYGSVVVLPEKTKPEVKRTVPKAPKMSQGKAKMLLQQMLQFHEDENIKTAVRSFFGHTPTFIVKLVLEQVIADQREELAKRTGATEPVLTVTQKALLRLMIGLDNLGDGQVCRTFLNTVDALLPTITNPAHLCPVTRLYVAICKRSLDMWRIRKALCISFTTMGDMAIPFMYIILQSWLEVMPAKETALHESLFAKAIVQLVLLKNCAQPGNQYANLHQLLKCYYKYPVEPLNSKELLLELFRNYIVEGNECLGVLSLALSKGLDKEWVFEQIDTEIKPQINAPMNINQVCTIVKLVGSMTRCHYETLDPSVIESNRHWLEKCCDTRFPDCVRDRATSALRGLPKKCK